jgi:hypothetical protein
MAKTLSKTGITNGQTIQPSHVTQSIDAFTATDAYDISLSGSLTLDVNGGYQMTASSGNYTSVIDPGTADLPSGASLTNANGSFTTFYGTYVPVTSSLLNGEVIADSVISASGFINEVKYGVDINQQYCFYQDFSPLFSNPPGTNINFVNQLGSIDDGDTNYNVITGDNVFVGGVKGVYIQGSNASEIGAYLTINESNPSGFIIGSNSVNTTGSDLLTIKRDSDGAEFFKTRNDGMIILAQLSSSFSASDDADAATKGVPTGGLYHTNGTVKIRLS